MRVDAVTIRAKAAVEEQRGSGRELMLLQVLHSTNVFSGYSEPNINGAGKAGLGNRLRYAACASAGVIC